LGFVEVSGSGRKLARTFSKWTDYRVADAQVGQWSNVTGVTVQP
jgi:hypothetical protein